MENHHSQLFVAPSRTVELNMSELWCFSIATAESRETSNFRSSLIRFSGMCLRSQLKYKPAGVQFPERGQVPHHSLILPRGDRGYRQRGWGVHTWQLLTWEGPLPSLPSGLSPGRNTWSGASLNDTRFLGLGTGTPKWS